MSDKLSEADARELIRVMHEDQGCRQPAFSREFALNVINTVSGWFTKQNYHHTLWFTRWEDVPVEEDTAVRLEPAPPSPNFDDIPF